MTVQTPQAVADTFFHRIATAEDVNEIAALVSEIVNSLVAGYHFPSGPINPGRSLAATEPLTSSSIILRGLRAKPVTAVFRCWFFVVCSREQDPAVSKNSR